jgi:hypothetical protein
MQPGQRLWSRCWAAWMRLSRAMGTVFGRVALTICYFTVLVPFAVLTKTISDPLVLNPRNHKTGPHWHPSFENTSGWDQARHQG